MNIATVVIFEGLGHNVIQKMNVCLFGKYKLGVLV
jgi:hypothetical protein